MRSSGSTPSPPERPIRLGVVLIGDDDPRKCTGRRLVRLGRAEEVRGTWRAGDGPILLDPYAPQPLTASDRGRAESRGLVAVDCSWNRLSAGHARGRPWPVAGRGTALRRLPLLVAANPQHFGRVGELNTAEALAAALALLGRADEAARLLEGFAGGPTFLDLNREALDRYRRAGSPSDLVREERALLGPP